MVAHKIGKITEAYKRFKLRRSIKQRYSARKVSLKFIDCVDLESYDTAQKEKSCNFDTKISKRLSSHQTKELFLRDQTQVD